MLPTPACLKSLPVYLSLVEDDAMRVRCHCQHKRGNQRDPDSLDLAGSNRFEPLPRTGFLLGDGAVAGVREAIKDPDLFCCRLSWSAHIRNQSGIRLARCL